MVRWRYENFGTVIWWDNFNMEEMTKDDRTKLFLSPETNFKDYVAPLEEQNCLKPKSAMRISEYAQRKT